MDRVRTDGGRHAAPYSDRAATVTGGLVFVLTPWLRAYRPCLPRVSRGAPVERPAMAPGAQPADPADVRLQADLDKYDLLTIGYLVVGAGCAAHWLIRRQRGARSAPAHPAVS